MPLAPQAPGLDAAVATWATPVTLSLAGWLGLVAARRAAAGARRRWAAAPCGLAAPRLLRRAAVLAVAGWVVAGSAGASLARSDADPPDLDRLPTRASPLHVVRPGETLWGIARAELSLRCRRRPPDPAVAVAWPRWYAANRAVVGADPDLIRPGQRLLGPVPTPRCRSHGP